MPTNIGPVIGVDGEKEYRKQINQIIQQAKTLDAEMKAVTSSFDSQNDSLKKLTAQSESLTKQIENQEKRIDLLQQMTDKAAQKYGEADTRTLKWRQAVADATTALNGMQSELSQVNQNLDGLSTEFEEAQKTASSFQEEMDTVFSSVDKIGTGLSVGVTAPLVALGTAGVKTYLDLNDAAAKLVAQTGATAEETEKYQDILEEIYQGGYGEDYEDIASSMAKVRQNLGEMDDLNLRKLTEDALQIRDTLGYDVAESTRAAKALMDNFGISAKDAFGYIVSGSQNGLDYSGELLDSISEYSVQFAKLGLDADDMFNIFQTGYETGSWNLDKMGDAIKELSIRVIDGSETTQQGFEAIGLSTDEMSAKFAKGGESAQEAFQETVSALAEMKDPLEQNIAGVNLFGTMWEDLGPEVVTQLAEISDETYGAEGAMDALNDSMSDAKKAEKNMREAQSALSEIGDSLVSIGLPVLEKFSDVLGDVSDWFDSLDDGGKNMVLTLGGIAVAAGPTVKAIGKIGSAVSGAKKFLDSFKSSTDNVSTAVEAVSSASGGAKDGVKGFGDILSTVGGAAGIAGVATGVLLGLGDALEKAREQAEIADWSPVTTGAELVTEALQNATGYLENFNTELFMSAEQQENLATNMQEIQDRITEICQIASSERRGYTQGEVEELENLMTELSELTEQVYSAYSAKVQAIETQAVDSATKVGEMGINEYVLSANEWSKTARDAYAEQTTVIDEETQKQITLLNQVYDTEDKRRTEEYQNRYDAIVSEGARQKQAAQESVANISSVYLQGMEEQLGIQDLLNQETSWKHMSLEEIWSQHYNRLLSWKQDYGEDSEMYRSLEERENQEYVNAVSTALGDLTENMDNTQGEALAALMEMALQTEVYGGEIDTKTEEFVKNIIMSLDDLPDEAKNPINDMLVAMKDEFNSSGAAELLAAAKDTAHGIASTMNEYLHFSRPDKGPLRYYDRWMPDFAKGLAQSAQKSLPTVRKIGEEMAQALTPTLPDYSQQVREAMERMARVEQQAQIYSDLQSDGITVNWDGSPADYPASTIQITVNAAPGQSEEQIADAVAYRLQHQVQQQRRGRL